MGCGVGGFTVPLLFGLEIGLSPVNGLLLELSIDVGITVAFFDVPFGLLATVDVANVAEVTTEDECPYPAKDCDRCLLPPFLFREMLLDPTRVVLNSFPVTPMTVVAAAGDWDGLGWKTTVPALGLPLKPIPIDGRLPGVAALRSCS